DVDPDDVVIYDAAGYPPLRDFLGRHGVRHVLLTGYATDMCFCRTTAGYQNLARDFNVFLVGDATLATFPANPSPRFATNAAISLASLNHLITQVSWVQYGPPAGPTRTLAASGALDQGDRVMNDHPPMSRRQVLAGSVAAGAGLLLAGRADVRNEPAPARRALVAITLDLEMSRNFPTWDQTHWDYE